MDDDLPQPTLFNCRDRTRRYGRRLREALEERRLAYRGADIGKETLSDSAAPAVLTVVDTGIRPTASLAHVAARLHVV